MNWPPDLKDCLDEAYWRDLNKNETVFGDELRMAQTPEGKVKAMVKKRIEEHFGARNVWRFMPVQTGFGSVALDFIYCIHGLFVSIETKAEARAGKGLTPLQRQTMDTIDDAGGMTFLVYDEATLDHAIANIRLAVEFHAAKGNQCSTTTTTLPRR